MIDSYLLDNKKDLKLSLLVIRMSEKLPSSGNILKENSYQ